MARLSDDVLPVLVKNKLVHDTSGSRPNPTYVLHVPNS